MPRQYQIHYKRTGSPKFAILEPHVSAPLYNKPEVTAAIEHVRANPSVVGIAVQIGNELFNIIAFDQAASAPRSFTFGESIEAERLEAKNDAYVELYTGPPVTPPGVSFDSNCAAPCGCDPGVPGVPGTVGQP